MVNFKDYELEDYIDKDVVIDMSEILEDFSEEYLPEEITCSMLQIYFLIRALDSNSFLSFFGSGYFEEIATKNIIKIDTQTLLQYIKEYNDDCDEESHKIKDQSLFNMFEKYCEFSNMSGHNDLNFQKHNFAEENSQTIIAYGINIFGVWLWAIANDCETLKEKICDYLENNRVFLKKI